MQPDQCECPATSASIQDADGAKTYYARRLVGDHVVVVSAVELTVTFNAEEIHLFSEAIEEGRTPPADKLIFRSGASKEARLFSLTRARLMDLILPTIAAPAKVFRARTAGGFMLVGPPNLDAGQRLTVIVAWDSPRRSYYVRTMYPMTQDQFRKALRTPGAKWPPK